MKWPSLALFVLGAQGASHVVTSSTCFTFNGTSPGKTVTTSRSTYTYTAFAATTTEIFRITEDRTKYPSTVTVHTTVHHTVSFVTTVGPKTTTIPTPAANWTPVALINSTNPNPRTSNARRNRRHANIRSRRRAARNGLNRAQPVADASYPTSVFCRYYDTVTGTSTQQDRIDEYFTTTITEKTATTRTSTSRIFSTTSKTVHTSLATAYAGCTSADNFIDEFNGRHFAHISSGGSGFDALVLGFSGTFYNAGGDYYFNQYGDQNTVRSHQHCCHAANAHSCSGFVFGDSLRYGGQACTCLRQSDRGWSFQTSGFSGDRYNIFIGNGQVGHAVYDGQFYTY